MFGSFVTTMQGTTTPQAAIAMDLRDITLTQYQWLGTDYAVAGNGNFGGLSGYGTTLNARDGVFSATAVVGSISVPRVGSFISKPTLTVEFTSRQRIGSDRSSRDDGRPDG